MAKKVLRLPEVQDRTGLTRPTIYKKMKEGVFPKPIRLSGRAVGCLEEDIDDWFDVQIARRGVSDGWGVEQ